MGKGASKNYKRITNDTKTCLVNGFDIIPYKFHPRILELRFVVLIRYLILQMGDRATVDRFITFMSEAYCINEQFLLSVVNRSSEILSFEKENPVRFVQEVALSTFLYGYDKPMLANLLIKTMNSLNNEVLYPYRPEKFLSKDWLDMLNEEVIICGVKAYEVELTRFLKAYEHIREVMG